MGAWRAWIAVLFVLPPCMGTGSELDDPPPQERATAPRALPTIGTRPTTRPHPLSPAPEITSFSPTTEIIAGGIITLRGRDLRPSDLVARLGTRRPVTLKILRSTSTAIRVLVPESAVTRGSPLTVEYPGSRLTTLEESFRVYPRPKFSNLVFRGEPRIGLLTEMNVTVENFAGLENMDVYLHSDCWRLGRSRSGNQLPASPGTVNVPLSLSFRRGDPALGPTENQMALSGRRCALDVSIGGIEPRLSTGLSIQFPTIAKYTIENTWELQNYSTPSGKTFKASVHGLPGACGPLSLGTAGSFPIGVVKHDNDISFQLRNGLMNLGCDFMTSPRLQVKDGWQITEIDWSVSQGNHCLASISHVEWAPGHWGQGPPLNPEYLDRVKTAVHCVVDEQDRARNSHLFRAVLRKIVLVGPPGQSWRAAFR